MDRPGHEEAGWPFDTDAIWRNRSLDEQMAGAKVWTGEESFVIENLTDEESEAFWAALEVLTAKTDRNRHAPRFRSPSAPHPSGKLPPTREF